MNYSVNVEKLSKSFAKCGLSIEDFSKTYKINPNFMQDLLHGNIPDMPLNEVVNLLNALNLKFNDLFIKG